MKVLGLQVGRNGHTAEAATVPRVPAEIGASGTLNLQGFLQQAEYNRDLRGISALQTYQRMLWSDGSVQESIEHLLAPLRAAGAEVEPASEEPADLEIAACVRMAFFDWLRQPWGELLDSLLDFLGYGFSVHEIVWQVVEDQLEVDDPNQPDPIVIPKRQYLVWRRFSPRLPETIWKWHVEQGELASVEQQVWTGRTYESVEIPAERLLVLVNKRRGDDFTGRSILRAAVKPWTLKEMVEKTEGIALERFGAGLIAGYLPERFAGDEDALGRLEDMLKNVRAGEFSYFAFPGPKATATRDGYEVEILTPGGSFPDFASAKEYHRAEIKASVLARFAELGHAAVGARATGDVQSIVWFAAIRAIANYIEAAFEQPIRQLVDANYPAATGYPKLMLSGLEERNLAEWADAVAKLVASGALLADRSFRAHVRSKLDAPEEDDDAEEQTGPDEPPDEPYPPTNQPPQNQPPSGQQPDTARPTEEQ